MGIPAAAITSWRRDSATDARIRAGGLITIPRITADTVTATAIKGAAAWSASTSSVQWVLWETITGLVG